MLHTGSTTKQDYLKNKQLSEKIQTIKSSLLVVDDKIPDRNTFNYINSIGVFTSEIGFPFINAFNGMCTLLQNYFPDIQVNNRIEMAVGVSIIDSSVHYILMFSVYLAAVGILQSGIKNKNKITREEFKVFNDIIAGLEKLPAESREQYRKEFEKYNFEIIQASHELRDTIFLEQFLKLILTIIQLGMFMGLRCSGGYFILINFFMIAGFSSLISNPIVLAVMWTFIGLYIASGYLTRYSAVKNLIYPPTRSDLVQLQKRSSQLFSDKSNNGDDPIGFKRDIHELRTEIVINSFSNEEDAPTPAKISYKISLEYIVKFSETAIPFIGDFVGMCALLKNLLVLFNNPGSHLLNLAVYISSFIITSLNNVVNCAIFFPIYKIALGFSDDIVFNEYKEIQRQLDNFNSILTDLLNSPQSIDSDKELEEIYNELMKKRDLYKNNEFLSYCCLAIYVLTRVGNGYFILVNFSSIVATSSFSLALFSNPFFMASFICLYALYGYLTRKDPVNEWLRFLPQSKFNQIQNKYIRYKDNNAEEKRDGKICHVENKPDGFFNWIRNNITYFRTSPAGNVITNPSVSSPRAKPSY